ncbi:baseplate J/gp47 family protein [Anaerovirgula multivorans]|nr:baseplate J/gp47 family protein [Anaerovirgula multivorans]
MEEILKAMLEAVSNKYDTREGSFIWDSLAAVAEQLSKLDDSITIAKEMFITSNLTGDELTTRVRDITGLDRRTAIKATGSVTVTGTGTINIGDLFETPGGIQFRATETKSIVTSGTVKIEALIAGSAGNVPAETITLFPITIAGFTTVINPDVGSGGFDEESDTDLVQRYYEKLREPATSGNIAHYKQWAKEVEGVGGVKVFPLWNGVNTVKVVIIDSDRQPATQTVVDAVQNYIDPDSAGLGEGEAPIGAYCTAISASALNIDISVGITLKTGYVLSTVTENIENNIVEFLKSIAFKEDFVSYALIGNAILNSEGVADYANLTLNGGTSNVTIDDEEVAILGVLDVV